MDGTAVNLVHFDAQRIAQYGANQSALNKSVLSEEFRAIKREVMRAAFQQESEPNRNRIMITSLNEQEGKTFTAFNLARSISLEQDKHVMLVDVNVLSPALSTMVSPAPQKGLIDYLKDPMATVPEIIYTTDFDRLRIIPMGSQHDLANELLSSQNMIDLMKEFRDRYNDRLVVFDAPPLMGVNETHTLSQHVDQIIIVVEDGRVHVRDLREVRRQLPRDVMVHFVLNKSMEARKWKNHRAVDDSAADVDSSLNGSHPFL